MKNFRIWYDIGKTKYLVDYYDGVKKNPDGSDFFDVRIFKNKKELKSFTDNLRNCGYIEQ